MKYNSKEIDNIRTEAVAALVKWAKIRVGYFPMRNAVNNYMEVIGANQMPMNGEEGLIAHRKIAAQGLASVYPNSQATNFQELTANWTTS